MSFSGNSPKALQCPQCGAPVKANARACDYCRTAIVYPPLETETMYQTTQMTTTMGSTGLYAGALVFCSTGYVAAKGWDK